MSGLRGRRHLQSTLVDGRQRRRRSRLDCALGSLDGTSAELRTRIRQGYIAISAFSTVGIDPKRTVQLDHFERYDAGVNFCAGLGGGTSHRSLPGCVWRARAELDGFRRGKDNVALSSGADDRVTTRTKTFHFSSNRRPRLDFPALLRLHFRLYCTFKIGVASDSLGYRTKTRSVYI